ncbi:hypothetical protein J1614_002855 [Plenodomus biglobosus]|nr:hypothetical protein J1614_002855 [Plenodomus biglobosus]
MADSNVRDGPAEGRKRAPTITIDTSAVNPNGINMTESVSMGEIQDEKTSTTYNPDDNSFSTYTQQLLQKLCDPDSFESNASTPTLPRNVSSPLPGWNGSKLLVVPAARSRGNSMDLDSENRDIYKDEMEPTEVLDAKDTLKPDPGTKHEFVSLTKLQAAKGRIQVFLHDNFNFRPNITTENRTNLSTTTTVSEIPGWIEDRHGVRALGDIGAKYNSMNYSYAERLGLLIQHQKVSKITIGSGNLISTAGTVTGRFRFQNEPEVYSILFNLLPNRIHDVILGKAFLKGTNTFKSQLHQASRVVKRVIQGVFRHEFFYLGDNALTFTGLLNGRPESALADSGSSLLIMDGAYARSLGLPISSETMYCNRLLFADNSTAMTSGMVHGVRWEFGVGGDSEEHIPDFHILENAPAAVIPSDDFLFGTNAFSRYDCYLVDEDEEDEEAYCFFAIDYNNNCRQKDAVPITRSYAELVRRGEAEDHIDDLPRDQQAEARLLEKQQQEAWDAQSHNSLQAQSTSATANPTAHQHGNITAIPPQQKSRWRCKLKRKRTPSSRTASASPTRKS